MFSLYLVLEDAKERKIFANICNFLLCNHKKRESQNQFEISLALCGNIITSQIVYRTAATYRKHVSSRQKYGPCCTPHAEHSESSKYGSI